MLLNDVKRCSLWFFASPKTSSSQNTCISAQWWFCERSEKLIFCSAIRNQVHLWSFWCLNLKLCVPCFIWVFWVRVLYICDIFTESYAPFKSVPSWNADKAKKGNWACVGLLHMWAQSSTVKTVVLLCVSKIENMYGRPKSMRNKIRCSTISLCWCRLSSNVYDRTWRISSNWCTHFGRIVIQKCCKWPCVSSKRCACQHHLSLCMPSFSVYPFL